MLARCSKNDFWNLGEITHRNRYPDFFDRIFFSSTKKSKTFLSKIIFGRKIFFGSKNVWSKKNWAKNFGRKKMSSKKNFDESFFSMIFFLEGISHVRRASSTKTLRGCRSIADFVHTLQTVINVSKKNPWTDRYHTF